jgi:hypothetical protein
MTSSSSTGDGGGKAVIEFPKSAEERAALRKAKQNLERQKLVNLFIDEAGSGALFHTLDGVAYADLIAGGIRQTWPIRSKQFRFEYIRYLQRQLEALTDKGAVLALALGPSLKKAAVNAAIDAFEMQAICSQVEREVHVRVAADGDDIYVDLADAGWHAVRVTALGWSIVQSPPVRFRRAAGMRPLPFPERGGSIDALRRGGSVSCALQRSSTVSARPRLTAASMSASNSGPWPLCQYMTGNGSLGKAASYRRHADRAVASASAAAQARVYSSMLIGMSSPQFRRRPPA